MGWLLSEIASAAAAAACKVSETSADAIETRGEGGGSPRNSAFDKDAGGAGSGAGGKSVAAGVVAPVEAKALSLLSEARPGLTVAVADAKACTSSCEPMEMNDVSGFGGGAIRAGGGAGFNSFTGGAASSGLGAGLIGGGAGRQETSSAGFSFGLTSGWTGTDGGTDEVWLAAAGPCEGKLTPQ